MITKLSNYTIDEKRKMLLDNGWYPFYDDNFWRTSSMSNMVGCSLNTAFLTLLKSKNIMMTKLPPDHIFVFGSNLEGIHGKGAAQTAFKYFGAIKGQGCGYMGQCYAIQTKQTPYITLPLDGIELYIHEFLEFAFNNEHLTFHITPVGCGFAGYSKEQILSLFYKSRFLTK